MRGELHIDASSGIAKGQAQEEADGSAYRRATSLLFIACLFLVVAAGCTTSNPRTEYLEQFQPARLTNMVAYRMGTNLEIRIPYPGRDAFAHASWPAPTAADGGFDLDFAPLIFDKEARATHKSTVTKANRVTIRNVKQWRQLVQSVFTALAPTKPGHAVVFLVQDEEVAVVRDKSGTINAMKLEQKPPEIIVDRTYHDADFSREAIRLLGAVVTNLDAKQNQFLFITGEDPAFVFMDLRQRVLVFLSYPQDPENQGGAGVFTMRVLPSLLFRSLVVAAIKNPFTLVSRALWHIESSGVAILESGTGSAAGPPVPLSTAAPMDMASWEKHLDGVVSARRYKGRINLFIDGDEFFPALIESVQGATRSVDVQVFIFDTDSYALKIADLLKARSAKVKVRVLTDDAATLFADSGSGPSTSDIDRYLTSGSKAETRASANPWITMDHRKCFIIDDRQAYIGGMNIGRVYRYGWHDMMVGVTGPVVGRFEKSFDEAWAHAGPFGDFAYAWESVFDWPAQRKNTLTNSIDVRPLRTATGKVDIYRAQLEAINMAKSYIYIENAYFDDDKILRALVRARRRGVDVRVIFPQENDSGIMQTSDQIVGNELIANGARVYVYPGMTHVKAAIYDGWACVGSANFSKMSLRVGQELDVAFSDRTTVDRLKQDLFEKDFSRSFELTSPVPLNWFDPFVKAFANQL